MIQPEVVLYDTLESICDYAVRHPLQETEFYMIVEADVSPMLYVLAFVQQPYSLPLYHRCEKMLSEIKITNNAKNTLSQIRGHVRYVNHIRMNDIPHTYTSYYQH